MVDARSTVRIINEAIRLLKIAAWNESVTKPDQDDGPLGEAFDNNLLEMGQLADAIHRHYPIMRTGD